jgi:hypothetical protein
MREYSVDDDGDDDDFATNLSVQNKTATKATLLRLLSYLQTPEVPRTSSFTNNWTGRFLVPFFTAFSALVKLRSIARAGRDITERIACASSQLRRKFETLNKLISRHRHVRHHIQATF